MAWYLLADSAGRLSDISDYTDSIDTASLKEAVNSGDISKSEMNYMVSQINNWNKAPYKTKKQRQTEIDWSKYGVGGSIESGSPSYAIGGSDDTSWSSIIHSPWTRITSMWGTRKNPFGSGTENHGGMDIAAPANTPIGSAVSGTVATAGWNSGGFGYHVKINGNDGMKYIYGHMIKQPSVSTGQQVNAGQLIGYVGSTGRSTGNHLHFQVGTGFTKATSVDPVPYLNTGVLYPGSEEIINTNVDSSLASSESTPKVKQNRYIPTSFLGGQGGSSDGADRIVGSVDGGINRLISYLDSIKAEQDEQRTILDAFSKSRNTSLSF